MDSLAYKSLTDILSSIKKITTVLKLLSNTLLKAWLFFLKLYIETFNILVDLFIQPSIEPAMHWSHNCDGLRLNITLEHGEMCSHCGKSEDTLYNNE